MAGIEYREIEPLVDYYGRYGKPNWSIWAGKTLKTCYDGGDIEAGAAELREILNQIRNMDTQTVYTLKVYDEGIKNVRSDAAYGGSFNFMLNPNVPVTRGENGMMVIDRTAAAPVKVDNTLLKELTEKIDRLEKENIQLRNDVFKAQLEGIKVDMEHKINGIAQAASKETTEDKIFGFTEKLIEKPDLVNHFFDGIGKLIDRFKSKQSNPTPEPSIGTTTQTFNMSEEIEEEEEKETTGEEPQLTAEEEAVLVRIDKSLETLAQKIGSHEKLAEALEALAAMSPGKIKSMVTMLV